MRAIGLFFVLTIIWIVSALIPYWGELNQHGAGFLIALVLFVGGIFAGPWILYLVCADAMSSGLDFPRNILIYTLLIVFGSVFFFFLVASRVTFPSTLGQWLSGLKTLFPFLVVTVTVPLWWLIMWGDAKSKAAAKKRRDTYNAGHDA